MITVGKNFFDYAYGGLMQPVHSQPTPGSAPAATPAPWPDNLTQTVTDAAQTAAATPAARQRAAKQPKENTVQNNAATPASEPRTTRTPRTAKAAPPPPAAKARRAAKAAKAAPAAKAPRGRKTVAVVVAEAEGRRGRPRGGSLELSSIIRPGEHDYTEYVREGTVRYRLMEAIVKAKGQRVENVLGKKVDADHEVGTVDIHFAVSEGYIVLK
jgi:hypothetical protein